MTISIQSFLFPSFDFLEIDRKKLDKDGLLFLASLGDSMAQNVSANK